MTRTLKDALLAAAAAIGAVEAGNCYIIVWRFEDAPAELQALSENSGDGDWLAVVPDYMRDYYIPWLEGPYFGRCRVREYPIAGSTVYIGCHA